MRRPYRFVGSIALVSALSLAGCGGSGTQTPSGSTDGAAGAQGSATAIATTSGQPAELNPGDVVTVGGKYGELKLTVDGFELNDTIRDRYGNDEVGADNTIGILYLTVENVSYDDSYNPGYVSLDSEVYLQDPDGVTLNPLSSGFGIGQYASAPGAFFYCAKGQKVRVAVEYVVPKNVESVVLVAQDAKVTIPSASFSVPSGSSALAGGSDFVKDKSTANVGEQITVSTDKGDCIVTVDGFDASARIRDGYVDSEPMSDDQTIGILKLTVQNVSYHDKYNDGFVLLDQDVFVLDGLGIVLPRESSTLDYGQYEGGALSYQIATGQTKRVAAFFVIDSSEDAMTVVVGDSVVTVPVAVA